MTKREEIVEILENNSTYVGSPDQIMVGDAVPDYNFEDVADKILTKLLPSEEEIQQDFKDWLGWNDQDPPDQDDPDYYTYSWGMNVWCNAYKAYKATLTKMKG